MSGSCLCLCLRALKNIPTSCMSSVLCSWAHISAPGHVPSAQIPYLAISFTNIVNGKSGILCLSGLWVSKIRRNSTMFSFFLDIYISAPGRPLSAWIFQILAGVFWISKKSYGHQDVCLFACRHSKRQNEKTCPSFSALGHVYKLPESRVFA